MPNCDALSLVIAGHLPNETKSKRRGEMRSFDPSTHGAKTESKSRGREMRPLRFGM
jgi:hypothetical protein